jgi:hypothetical protein
LFTVLLLNLVGKLVGNGSVLGAAMSRLVLADAAAVVAVAAAAVVVVVIAALARPTMWEWFVFGCFL